MEEGRSLLRAGITTTIDALEIARISLEERGPEDPTPEIVASIRRIARSIRNGRSSLEEPAIASAARALEEAAVPEIHTRLSVLLDRLRQPSGRESRDGAVLLVISSDAAQVETVEKGLTASHREFRSAASAEEAEEILEKEAVSLVLLDLFLPDTDGRNLLVRLRERPATAALPVVVLAEKSGPQPKTECFALGADAYFERPLDVEVLSGAVSRLLQTSAERSRESRQDPLTRLPNRAAFREAFHRVSSLSTRIGDSLTIAIIDLDHFKMVNDTFGHPTGDEVLKRFARVMAGSLRRSDILARWGGEEFVALLPNTTEKGAVQAIEKALEAVMSEELLATDGRTFHVSFSAGVAPVAHGSTVEDATAEADRYLYLAKSAGRSRVLSAESSVIPPKERILLAERDDYVSSVVKSRLEHEGFEVVLHDWTPEQPESYRGGFSLVLLDVESDESAGFALLSTLRNMWTLAKVPIVLLTSFGNAEHIVKGFQLGANDYILKPFSSTELVARVLRLLKKR